MGSRLQRILTLMVLAVFFAAPAWASCMPAPEPRKVFRDKPPETVTLGDTVLKVRFHAFVAQARPVTTLLPVDREEIEGLSSCEPYTLYRVEQVVSGAFDSDWLVLDEWEAQMDRGRSYYLAGTLQGERHVFTSSLYDWDGAQEQKYRFDSIIVFESDDIRPIDDGFKPDQLDTFWRGASALWHGAPILLATAAGFPPTSTIISTGGGASPFPAILAGLLVIGIAGWVAGLMRHQRRRKSAP